MDLSLFEHLLQDKAESLGPGPREGLLAEARRQLADGARGFLDRCELFCYRLALAGAGHRLLCGGAPNPYPAA